MYTHAEATESIEASHISALPIAVKNSNCEKLPTISAPEQVANITLIAII